jgi:type I restriction enzyme S subunit
MYGDGDTKGRSVINRTKISGNQAICCLVPDRNVIYEEYLLYYVKNIKNDLRELARGAGQDNLNQSLIINRKIPVPSLDEQERIVEAVEERLERMERLEKSVQSVRQLSSEYENSIMSYVFSNLDFVSEESARNLPEEGDVPEDWEITTLGDIAHFQNGNDFSKSQWENKGRPIIRIQNLTGTGDSFNYFSGDIHNRYSVEKGNILFSWSGTIDAFRWSGGDAWLNQHIYRVDANDSVEDDYMYYLLKRSAEILEKEKVGGTLQHIRKGDVTGLQVPLPPKEEQREMVERLESIDFSILEKSVTDTTALLKEYRDSVLWYAFQDTSEADL